MFQYNRFAQVTTLETTPQDTTVTQPTALVAIPIQQTATKVTYAQPVTIPAAAPTQPVVTTSEQPQHFPKFCALCTTTGRQAGTSTYYIYTQNGHIQRRNRRTLISKIEKENKKWNIGMLPYKTEGRKRSKT